MNGENICVRYSSLVRIGNGYPTPHPTRAAWVKYTWYCRRPPISYKNLPTVVTNYSCSAFDSYAESHSPFVGALPVRHSKKLTAPHPSPWLASHMSLAVSSSLSFIYQSQALSASGNNHWAVFTLSQRSKATRSGDDSYGIQPCQIGHKYALSLPHNISYYLNVIFCPHPSPKKPVFSLLLLRLVLCYLSFVRWVLFWGWRGGCSYRGVLSEKTS